jgi:hypothetical protein
MAYYFASYFIYVIRISVVEVRVKISLDAFNKEIGSTIEKTNLMEVT